MISEADIVEGAAIEKEEHGLTDEQARKVAMDHLKENPDYYRILKKAGLREIDSSPLDVDKQQFKAVFRFRLEQAIGADDILRGVIVCEEGEAKGHGFRLSHQFLMDVVKLCAGQTLKVRLDHPEEGKSSKLETLVGKAANWRLSTVERDGKQIPCVRADIELLDVPEKSRLKTYAAQAADLFGMSLDFIGKLTQKAKDGMRDMIACVRVDAVDFVGEPAATRSLLSAVDSKGFTRSVAIPQETLELLGVDPKDADEYQILSAIRNAAAKAKTPTKPEPKNQLSMKISEFVKTTRAQLAKLEAEAEAGRKMSLKEHLAALAQHLDGYADSENQDEHHAKTKSMLAELAEAYGGEETSEEEKKEKDEGDTKAKEVKADASAKPDLEQLRLDMIKAGEAAAAKTVTAILAKTGGKAHDKGEVKKEDKSEVTDESILNECSKEGRKMISALTEADRKTYLAELKTRNVRL
jgi:hypothetical protein